MIRKHLCSSTNPVRGCSTGRGEVVSSTYRRVRWHPLTWVICSLKVSTTHGIVHLICIEAIVKHSTCTVYIPRIVCWFFMSYYSAYFKYFFMKYLNTFYFIVIVIVIVILSIVIVYRTGWGLKICIFYNCIRISFVIKKYFLRSEKDRKIDR